MATVYREIFICVLFLLSLSASGFKTGQISMFQAQLCLGKFKTGQNRSQEGRNNTGRK